MQLARVRGTLLIGGKDMSHRMWLLAAVCTVCCVLPSSLAATIATAASTTQPSGAAPMCAGLPATIVGSPDTRRLRGTAGADVIITAGAQTVVALAGDDTICITGRTEVVEAGTGDDHVTSDDRNFETYVLLDEGADTFVGGARRDRVVPGAGADHVETGAGRDSYDGFVWPGTEPNDDPLVSLGGGNDAASVDISNLTGVLDGGPGLNMLSMNCCAADHGIEWVVSNVTETATADGDPRFQWDRFRGFTFGEFNLTGTIEFEGSDARERVVAGGEFGSPDIARMALRGGNDTLIYSRMLGPVRAGEGLDWVRLVNFADPRSPASWNRAVTVDLNKHRIGIDDRAVRVRGVENIEVSDFIDALVQGDAQDNQFIVGQTCRAKLYGGRGDDTLRSRLSSDRCPRLVEGPRWMRAFGGRGDDILAGRWTPDLLVGGRDNDSADGRGNVDVCRAEALRRCER
jgi:Ca2+-binding RTX toxin-like protein